MSTPHGQQPAWGQDPARQNPPWQGPSPSAPSPWAPQPQADWPAPPPTAWAPQPAPATPWTPPGAAPPSPSPQPPPSWAPPAPPPAASRSRRGLWWGLGSAALALVVVGSLLFVLTRGVGTPEDVAAQVRDDAIELSWSAARAAETYEIYRGDDLLGTTTQTTYRDDQAPGGTEHRYAVVAVDADGARSDRVSAGAVLAPVDAPDTLTVATDSTGVIVEWDAVTGAERYELSRDGDLLADDLTEGQYRDPDVGVGDHEYLLTAVDEDGAGSTASSTAQIFTRGPWQDAYAIGLAFPDLVSGAPGGQGWAGSTCDVGSGPGVVSLISCQYPTGIYVQVLQFPDTPAQDAKVEEVRAVAEPGGRTWAGGSTSADSGGLFLNRADSTTAWMFLTFWDTDLDLFAVYAEWSGHTGPELQAAWFADAPLPTD
jgi:hypothetical protein